MKTLLSYITAMKTRFSLLSAFLCLLCACTQRQAPAPDFMQNEFAFPLPVSSLSDGKDCLWIGTETGSVAKFDPRTGRYSDPVFIDFGHVYCIREVYDDMLLVGIRNSGLKLVEIKDGNIAEIRTQFVLEGHRGINFSPYSFFVKQAEDAAGTTGATAPDTLFCGTSNGLFWFPMPQDCNGLDDREDLIPIYEKYDDPGIKFLSVVSCDGKVYGGSTEGLFKVMDGDSEKADERFEILGKTPVSHLSVSEGCLYVLDGRGRVYSSEQMEETVRYDRNIPLAFFCDNGLRFAVTDFNLNISGTEGDRNVFPLNGRSAIGGENDRGRECFLRHGNYYYVAIEHGICRIPVHLNLSSKVHVISAVAGPSPDKIYALTEKSGLYRIKRDGKRARFIRTLTPDRGNAVKGLDGCIGRDLIFHTKDRIYSIRPGFFSKISMIKDMPARDADIQQVIVLPDSRIIAAYSDTTFIFDRKSGKAVSMDIGADSYVTAVDFAPDKQAVAGYRIWAGTLNKGLYLVDTHSGECTEISAGDTAFRSVIDLKATENNVHILVPGKIVRMECSSGQWIVADTTEVPHDVRSLFISGGNLYAVSVSGGLRAVAPVSEDGETRTYRLMYPDISFLPDEIRLAASADGTYSTGLISENGVIYGWTEDATDSISYAGISVPNWFVRMMCWKGGWGAIIFALICIAALAASSGIGHKIAKAFKSARDVLRVIKQRHEEIKNIRLKLEEYRKYKEDIADDLKKLEEIVTDIYLKASEDQYLVSDAFNEDKLKCGELLNAIEKKLATIRQRREEVEDIRKKTDEYRSSKEDIAKELEVLDGLIEKANDSEYLVSDSYKADKQKCSELLNAIEKKLDTLRQRREEVERIRKKTNEYRSSKEDIAKELEELDGLIEKANDSEYLVSDSYKADKQKCNELLNAIEKKLATIRQRREEVKSIRMKMDEYMTFKEDIAKELEELEKLLEKANSPEYLVSDSYKADKQKCGELLNAIEKKLATIRQRREEVEDIRKKTDEYRSSKEDIAKELEVLDGLIEKANDSEYLVSDSYKADKQKCNELLNAIEKKIDTLRQRREEVEDIRKKTDEYMTFKEDIAKELEVLDGLIEKANSPEYLVSDSYKADKQNCNELLNAIEKKLDTLRQRREEVERIRKKTNEYRSSKEDIAKELEELDGLIEKANDSEYLVSDSYKADKQKCSELLNAIEKKLDTLRQRREEVKSIRMKKDEYMTSKEDIAKELEELDGFIEKANDSEYLVSDSYKADRKKCHELLNIIDKKLVTLRQRREEVEVIRKKVDEYRPFKEAVDEELEELEKLIAKANDPQYLVSDSYKPDRKKCHELLKTMDRKISQSIQSIFDYQSSQLEKLCETNIISYNILDEYRDAIGSSDLQKAASVNESVTKIIDNLCSHKHWFRLLDEISADDRIVIYSDNSTIVENLKHLKATHKKIKNCKLEELITLSETLNSMIQTFSSENIHDAIRNIFIEHLKNSGIDTEEYIIKKVIDIISRTTDQLEFISKCMYNISHIEPLRKLSEIAKFIDTSLNELDEIRSEDKDFNIGENKKRRDNLIKDFGAHAFGLYEKLCDEDKDILKACTMKVTNEKYETFLVFLSAIYGIKNTPGKKTHIRYLCRRPTSAVEFEKSKSKLREKFLLYDNLNKSTYNQAVVVPALFETAIKFYGRSQKDNKSADSAEK